MELELFANEEERKEIFRRMVSAALMAAHYGQCEEADTILNALEELRPDNATIKITRGLSLIYSDRLEDAVRYLREIALPMFPDNEDGITALGLAYKLTGREKEAAEVLQRLVDSAKEVRIREHAMALLELNAPSDPRNN